MNQVTRAGLLVLGLAGALGAQDEVKLSPKEAKAHFEKADKALNEAWAKVKKSLAAPDFETLKAEQKAWVEHRDYLALSPELTGAPEDETKARTSPEYHEMAAGLTEDRTKWLEALIAEPVDETLTGKWTDSYGGQISLVHKENELFFVVEVVRGPTAHSGALAGRAAYNDPLGWYSDKGLDPEKTDETNLAFIARGAKLELVGANTSQYHGARAYFDGIYVRTAALSAAEVTEVTKEAETGGTPDQD